jgi:hypothetical protein
MAKAAEDFLARQLGQRFVLEVKLSAAGVEACERDGKRGRKIRAGRALRVFSGAGTEDLAREEYASFGEVLSCRAL